MQAYKLHNKKGGVINIVKLWPWHFRKPNYIINLHWKYRTVESWLSVPTFVGSLNRTLQNQFCLVKAKFDKPLLVILTKFYLSSWQSLNRQINLLSVVKCTSFCLFVEPYTTEPVLLCQSQIWRTFVCQKQSFVICQVCHYKKNTLVK